MSGQHAVWRKVASMFLGERDLVVPVLVWVIVCWLLVSRAIGSPFTQGIVLFAGLAVILMYGVVRGARRR